MDRDNAETEFREFVASRLVRLRRLAFLMCGDMQRAEDVVQLALARLYAVWHRIDRGGLDAYVRRVVINTGNSYFARLWLHREQPTSTVPDRLVDDANTHTADRMVILSALARLPRRQRAVVVLRYWEDRSVAETAEILRCSHGAIKSQSARGLRTLRKLLSDTYAMDEEMVPACPI